MYIPSLIKKYVVVETSIGEVKGKLLCLTKENRHIVLVDDGKWIIVKGWKTIKCKE